MLFYIFRAQERIHGHLRGVFYAVSEEGGFVEFGASLGEALYFAYDLVACLKLWEEPAATRVDKKGAAALLEVSEDLCIGSVDVDADNVGNLWVRHGDLRPRKGIRIRKRGLERAFELSY